MSEMCRLALDPGKSIGRASGKLSQSSWVLDSGTRVFFSELETLQASISIISLVHSIIELKDNLIELCYSTEDNKDKLLLYSFNATEYISML